MLEAQVIGVPCATVELDDSATVQMYRIDDANQLTIRVVNGVIELPISYAEQTEQVDEFALGFGATPGARVVRKLPELPQASMTEELVARRR